MNKLAKDKRTPARAALADAIEAVYQAQRPQDVIANAIERAVRVIGDAETRLVAAKDAIASAKEAQARRVAFSAEQGEVSLLDPAVRSARLDETIAEDELDAARRALEHLKAHTVIEKDMMDQPIDPMSVARRGLETAVRNVVMSAPLDAYVSSTAKLQAELAGRRQVLGELMKKGLVADRLLARESPLIALMVDYQLPQWLGGMGFQLDAHHAAVAPLQAALEALKSDPDVELPL